MIRIKHLRSTNRQHDLNRGGAGNSPSARNSGSVRLAHGRIITAWSVAHAINDGCTGAVLAAIPSLIVYKGFDQQTITTIIAIGSVISSIGQPIAGLAVDKTRRTAIGAIGLIASGVGLAMSFAGRDAVGITMAILLLYVGSCIFHPAAAYSIRRFADAGPRSTAVFATGGALGFAVAPLLFRPEFVQSSWLMATMIAIPGVLISVLCLLANRMSPTDSLPNSTKAERRFRPNRMFLLAVAAACLWSTIFLGINTFLPLTMHYSFGVSLDAASKGLGFFGGGGVLGTLMGGWIAARIGLKRTMIIAGVASTAGTVALGLTGDAAWIPVLAFALGAALYLAYAPQLLIAMKAMPHHTAAVSAIILGSSTTIGSVFVPVFNQVSESFGHRATLIALIPVAVLIIVVSTFFTSDRVINERKHNHANGDSACQ